MKKIVLLLTVIMLFVFSITGLAVEKGGELEIGLDADPPMLDPHLSTAMVDRQVFQSLYDTLIEIDENMELVPGLAEDWTIEEDGTRYVFELREDVVFHDGSKFDAEAVEYNFERMLDSDFASPRSSDLSLVKDFEVLDEYKIAVTLKEPFAPFLATLADRAGMMVSPESAEEEGEDFANQPVGTGPFKFVERKVQEEIILEKNEDYWKEGTPYLDRVVFRPFPDDNVRVLNLTDGDLDIIDTVPPKDMEKLETETTIKLSNKNGLGFQGIWVNKEKKPLDNDKLARALSLSIDRKALVDTVFKDAAVPGNSPFPPGTTMHDKDQKVPEVDPVAAEKLLKEAGKSDGYKLKLMVESNPTVEQTAEVIQSMASRVGIDVEIELIEFGSMVDRLEKGDYQAALLGWSGRVDPDGNTYRFFHSEGSMNDSNYENKEVDNILDKTREVTDNEERKKLFQEMMGEMNAELPYIFLYHPREISALKEEVKGFTPYPDGLFRLSEVWLED
ncbi:MAG: ABC transporter substrate-binding protein [Halanaerobiales bacterium]